MGNSVQRIGSLRKIDIAKPTAIWNYKGKSKLSDPNPLKDEMRRNES